MLRSWFVRLLRGRRLDRNPLRRPSDRAETLIAIWLLVAFAVAAPLTAQSVGARASALAQHSRVVALATRRPVTAITLQRTPPENDTPYALITQAWVTARWTTPDGRTRTGDIQVGDGTPIGAREQIWVTASGNLAAPPLPVPELARLADLASFGAVLALAFLFMITGGILRYVLTRRRMAAWEAEWAAAEPRWNRQRW